jgi:hypothetical protein
MFFLTAEIAEKNAEFAEKVLKLCVPCVKPLRSG